LLDLAGRLTELELAVATHYVSSNRYKELERDVQDSKNMYLEAVKDMRLELQEKDKDLKEREEEIKLLSNNITALAQFQKRCVRMGPSYVVQVHQRTKMRTRGARRLLDQIPVQNNRQCFN
jgi:hypothetical protein